MNAWSQLPNAACIDRVIAHVKAHPEKWRVHWGASWAAPWGVAWDTARSAVLDAVFSQKATLDAAEEVAQEVAQESPWDARYACYALIAWDDCGYLLDYTPDQLRAVLTIDPTYHAARLLLPAVMTMKGGDA